MREFLPGIRIRSENYVRLPLLSEHLHRFMNHDVFERPHLRSRIQVKFLDPVITLHGKRLIVTMVKEGDGSYLADQGFVNFFNTPVPENQFASERFEARREHVQGIRLIIKSSAVTGKRSDDVGVENEEWNDWRTFARGVIESGMIARSEVPPEPDDNRSIQAHSPFTNFRMREKRNGVQLLGGIRSSGVE